MARHSNFVGTNNISGQSNSDGKGKGAGSPLDFNPYHDSFARPRFHLPIVGTGPFSIRNKR